MRRRVSLRTMIDFGGRMLPAGLLSKMSGVSLAAPCYHLVRDGALPPHIRHLYSCRSTKAFEGDLDYLLRWGAPVSLDDLEKSAGGVTKLPSRAFFVSFDDGLAEVADIVAPICLRKGVPMTMFLNSSIIDSDELAWRHKVSLLIERLQVATSAERKRVIALLQARLSKPSNTDAASLLKAVTWADRQLLDLAAGVLNLDFRLWKTTNRPYLSSEQLRQMIARGFSIGTHSDTHPLYSQLSDEQRINETQNCCTALSQLFGSRSRPFAFPFVSDGVPADFFVEAFHSGLASLIFCIGGHPMEGHPRVIERFVVEDWPDQSMEIIFRRYQTHQTLSRFRKCCRRGSGGAATI